MLAAERSLTVNSYEVVRTPLLIPSFSIKGFRELSRLVEIGEEVITDAVLISAYDIFHHHIKTPINFADIVFLDSGGYEADREKRDFSDLGYADHVPKLWNEYFYRMVLDNWHSEVPTVVVSFDHPNVRHPIGLQIERAHELLPENEDTLRTFLLKPEKPGQNYVDVRNLTDHLDLLRYFDILGMTEKELGASILERMVNTATARIAMNNAGINMPIHIFGSLDTISTPLYFLAGADIFDGLSWLRLAYRNGVTMYLHNYYPLEFGIDVQDEFGKAKALFKNVYYLNELSLQMREFSKNGRFDAFGGIGDFLAESYERLEHRIKET